MVVVMEIRFKVPALLIIALQAHLLTQRAKGWAGQLV
jgi:hypothetical protein